MRTGHIRTAAASPPRPRRSWLWAWANESLPPRVLGDIKRVRQFGEENDHPVLPWPGFDYQPDLVAEARMVAASVLDADGLWAESTDDLQLLLLIHDLSFTAERL
ncbi:DUF6882 domain-containing protein [Streptomyces sp. NPDC053755]|uniref:DUF6882 domain-containing protein n=1 Tax=Streptomyces sp. NPDC053755 TaxID=3155815 RepID=UPI00342CF325